MRRSIFVLLVAALVAGCAFAMGPGGPARPPPAAAAALPAAWIVVDARSGVVLEAGNERTPLPPASTTKLLTALVARHHLGDGATVAVSPRAAAMPARKLNLVAGHRWPLDQLLAGLLLSSANDVATALAEGAGGSSEGFAALLASAGHDLGLADRPVLQDPSGLDDLNSVGGGNRISARDLAIVARAALADPVIARLVATRVSEFTDPAGVARRLVNHNKMLASYPGTTGMKTGYTRRAGQTLVASAERGGRTLIAVVLRTPASPYIDAAALLDRGFATPAATKGTGDHLPPVRSLGPPVAAGAELAAASGPAPAAERVQAGAGRWLSILLRITGLVVVTVAGLRTRVLVRRARRRRRRALARARRRHPTDVRLAA